MWHIKNSSRLHWGQWGCIKAVLSPCIPGPMMLCCVAHVFLLLHQWGFRWTLSATVCQNERGFTDSKCCADSQRSYMGKYTVIEWEMPFYVLLTETTTDHNAMQQHDIWMRSTVVSFSQLEKLSVYGATVLFHLWILNIHIVDMNTESLQPSFESCWVVLALCQITCCPHCPLFFSSILNKSIILMF